MRFTPANLATGENTATIDLSPLLSGDDEEYELIVSGKDVVGNTAGELDYHINFRVISKPMISNCLIIQILSLLPQHLYLLLQVPLFRKIYGYKY